MDCFLFRRALLGTSSLSENVIYKKPPLIIVGNLSVFSKAKALLSSLSLIMFSELYHGGPDEILALCSRKSLYVCVCFHRSHSSHYHSTNTECLKLAKFPLYIYFIFYLILGKI